MKIVACVLLAACGSSSDRAGPAPAPAARPTSPARSEPPPAPLVERRLHPTSVDASSFLESSTLPYLQYHPNYAVDGDPKTAWNEGTHGKGANKYLRFHVTPQRDVSRVRLRVLDGFQYSDAIYRANPRAKTIEVRLLPAGTPPFRQVLADDKAWQEIVIPTEAPAVDAIELAVVDVYPGAKYKDLAISEIELYATSRTPEQPDVEKQHLDAIVAWKKRQHDMTELVSAGAIDLVASNDPATIPSEADKLFERGQRPLGGSSQLFVSRKEIDVTADALLDCADKDDFDAACFAPLYSTIGLAMTERDHAIKSPSDCTPFLTGSSSGDAIDEIAIVRCEDTSSRGGFEFRLSGVVLEYDDSARLRAIVSRNRYVWLEWGTRAGKPAIVGGAWRELYGQRAHALRPKS